MVGVLHPADEADLSSLIDSTLVETAGVALLSGVSIGYVVTFDPDNYAFFAQLAFYRDIPGPEHEDEIACLLIEFDEVLNHQMIIGSMGLLVSSLLKTDAITQMEVAIEQALSLNTRRVTIEFSKRRRAFSALIEVGGGTLSISYNADPLLWKFFRRAKRRSG